MLIEIFELAEIHLQARYIWLDKAGNNAIARYAVPFTDFKEVFSDVFVKCKHIGIAVARRYGVFIKYQLYFGQHSLLSRDYAFHVRVIASGIHTVRFLDVVDFDNGEIVKVCRGRHRVFRNLLLNRHRRPTEYLIRQSIENKRIDIRFLGIIHSLLYVAQTVYLSSREARERFAVELPRYELPLFVYLCREYDFLYVLVIRKVGDNVLRDLVRIFGRNNLKEILRLYECERIVFPVTVNTPRARAVHRYFYPSIAVLLVKLRILSDFVDNLLLGAFLSLVFSIIAAYRDVGIFAAYKIHRLFGHKLEEV